MKPKILLLLVFVLICKLSFSQSYLPFQFGNTKWMVNEANMFRTKSFNYFSMDSTAQMINSKYYYTIVWQASPTYTPSSSTFYLRNDTAGQKVFILPQMSPTEYLLYDFNVSVGDTVFNVFNNAGVNFDTVLIDSIQSKPINGITRKHIYLHSIRTPQSPQPRLWIEGIGSDYDLLFPSYLFTDPSYSLVCQEYNGFINYGNNFDCSNFLTALRNQTSETAFKIYPNPARDFIVFEQQSNVQEKLTYSLYTVHRKEVNVAQLHNDYTTKLDVSNLSNGIYFVVVKNRFGVTLKGEKIILE